MTTLDEVKRSWTEGEFRKVYSETKQLVEVNQPSDELLSLHALAAYSIGDYGSVVEANKRISRQWKRSESLNEAVVRSYVQLGRTAEARAYGDSEKLLRDAGIAEQLRLAIEHPMEVTITGVVEIPFTDDRLSSVMPGMTVQVDGHDTVARFDSGGNYVHLTKTQADAWGVSYVGGRRAFAGLQFGKISHGVVELQMGSISIKNAPVAVLPDSMVPSAAIAKAYGEEVGPIIGTNIFSPFLSSIDSLLERFVFSGVNDAAARREHLALIGTASHVVPFGLVSSHLLIARGRLGEEVQPLFVDSGLVAADEKKGQAAILASKKKLTQWGAVVAKGEFFADLPFPISIGDAAQSGHFAFPVSARMWRSFGNWSGIDVEALISYGFLKRYCWTIDFANREFLFTE